MSKRRKKKEILKEISKRDIVSSKKCKNGTKIACVFSCPGQEEENADFLVRNGVAIWIKNDDNVARILKHLYRHPERVAEMKSNIPALAKPNSTKDICDILMSTL